MNNNLLKENKVHGDTSFPLASYSVEYSGHNIAVDCHWHNEFEFLIVNHGSMDFIVGTEENVTVNAGEIIFINSGELHSGYLKSERMCKFEAIVFSPEFLYNSNIFDPVKEKYMDPLIRGEFNLPRMIRPQNSSWENEILIDLREILSVDRERSFGYEMFIKGKMYNIFSKIFLNLGTEEQYEKKLRNNNNSERLKMVMEFIYKNYNRKITVNEMAQLLNMSEGYFIKFFKAMVRKTPIEYINYYRINKAAQLLIEDKKIIEISGDVGFDNVSYFVTMFKYYMKTTPAQYRKNISI